LIKSEYCIISDNEISFNNENGIDLYLSNNNSINGNTIDSNSLNGINIGHSSYNTMKNNYISNSEFGIYITSSFHNTIKGNEIDLNNGSGITIIDYDFNDIQSNNLSEKAYGFRCLSLGSYDNIIYHNNFLNNAENAYDKSDRGNTWDDGKYGNFWSDYKQKYPNAKKLIQDGIWDTPYEIPNRDNKDNCPLIRQWPKSSSNTIQITFSKIYFLLQWLIDQFQILEKLLF
jgi:parallel beta-helix repeat protein